MAIEKEIKIRVDTTQAEQGVKKINKELDQTVKESKKVGDSSGQAFGKLDSLTGGAIGKIKGFSNSLKGVAGGFKSIGGAIALSGIGLLLLVVGSLVTAFKSSEEGQNKFAKLMGVIGSVTGNVIDVISDIGMFIIDIFSGDSEALKSLKEFGGKIFNIIGLPIKNAIDTVKALGKVLGALFDGDISGAFDELEKGVQDIKGNFVEAGETVKGFYDGAIEGSKEFVKQLAEEAKIAGQIADQRAKADKLDRGLIVQRAEANRKVAELREKAARRDLFTDKQRKDFLIEAGKINDEITKKEIESARLKSEAIIAENKLTKSTKEDKDAEAQSIAKLIELETARIQTQRRLSTEISAINETARSEAEAAAKTRATQTEAEQKAAEAKAAKDAEIETNRLEKIDEARSKFLEKIADREADTEEKRLEREKEKAQEELDKLIGTELEKQEAQIALDQLFADKKKEIADKRAEEQKEIDDKKNEEEKARNEKRRNEEIEAEKTVAETKKEINNSYLNSVSSGLDVLGGLFEENKELQAGILVGQNIAKIAENIISTQAANAKIVAEGAALAIPTAGTSVAAAAGLVAANNISSGISIAASIAATAKGLSGLGKSGGGGGAPSASNQGGRPQAPAFNLTASSGVNQLAGDVEGAAPVRAFVVGSDVTNQQEMDRATFGQAAL